MQLVCQFSYSGAKALNSPVGGWK